MSAVEHFNTGRGRAVELLAVLASGNLEAVLSEWERIDALPLEERGYIGGGLAAIAFHAVYRLAEEWDVPPLDVLLALEAEGVATELA